MLKDTSNNVNENDVVTIKLVTGDELIGKLVTKGNNSVTISKPLSVVLQMVQQQHNGRLVEVPNVSFMPYMFSVDEETKYSISLDKIVVMCKSAQVAAQQYIKSTSSIVPSTTMPDSNGIIRRV